MVQCVEARAQFDRPRPVARTGPVFANRASPLRGLFSTNLQPLGATAESGRVLSLFWHPDGRKTVTATSSPIPTRGSCRATA
jgi:hypothetical protein